MTYDQFWFASPFLATAYRKKHYLELEQQNTYLWLQGCYFHEALQVALSNAFADKGKKAIPYLEKPIDILPKTPKQIAEEEEKARQSLINRLNQWKSIWDSQHKPK